MRRRRPLIPLLLLLAAAAAGGCYKPLFESGSRTQYEKYDTMRNRYVPAEEPDEFGNPRPALRSRLSQN